MFVQCRVQSNAQSVTNTRCYLYNPEYVHIEWSTRDGHTCRTFLLANGRLKLETVQKTFGTTLVQIRKGENIHLSYRDPTRHISPSVSIPTPGISPSRLCFIIPYAKLLLITH